jgi:two-component system cell cycle sensor histidine kinase/response regulator CckA
MNQGVFYQDADGRLIDANSSALRMFGLTLEQFLDKTCDNLEWDLIHEDRSPFSCANHPSMMALRTGKPVTDVVAGVFNPQIGSYVWMVINAIPQFHSGETVPYRVFVTLHDITERKRAEEERMRLEQRLQQTQKTESLARMAGGIAHHFNNMLGAVIGNMELALLNLPQESLYRANIIEAMKASRRAAEISGLMLSYLGQTTGKKEPLDLERACKEVLSLLGASLPGKVRLQNEFPQLGPTILAVGVHIKQILTNLVLNAGEAIGEQEGTITVAIRVMAATEIGDARFFPSDWQPKAKNYACLSVSDTGCGLDSMILERIFDPFFSTKFAGRGLGLPVVLGLVRAHGGAIIVESQPGCGARFQALFPLPEPELLPPRQEETLVSEPFEGQGLVLVVEDEPMLRDLAKTMLMRLGYLVITASDGMEAVEIFRVCKDEFRLVLLDLTMPRMSGWEALSKLRTLRPDIPVILASGYEEAHVMCGHHSELPQTFLHKPYQMKDLKEALGAVQKISPGANKGAP